MSSFVVCPDCKRKLKVPETMMGKAFRCPACKAVISPLSKSHSPASDPESDDSEAPSPSRPVKTAPSGPAAPATSRSRPPRDEEPVDDLEVVDEKPIRPKSSRKRRPTRKKSSAGLIVKWMTGGAALLIVLGIVGGLLWPLFRLKTIPESEWQAFSPPNSGCTVLMPGAPSLKNSDMPDIKMNQYLVERNGGKEAFSVAIYDVSPRILQLNPLDTIADNLRTGMLRAMDGSRVTKETAISLGNIPGREFQFNWPSHGLFIARAYFATFGETRRGFAVMAGGTNIQPNKGDAARFFDSFKIDTSATPPTLADAAVEGGVQPPIIEPPPANPQPNLPPGVPGARFPRRPRP